MQRTRNIKALPPSFHSLLVLELQIGGGQAMGFRKPPYGSGSDLEGRIPCTALPIAHQGGTRVMKEQRKNLQGISSHSVRKSTLYTLWGEEVVWTNQPETLWPVRPARPSSGDSQPIHPIFSEWLFSLEEIDLREVENLFALIQYDPVAKCASGLGNLWIIVLFRVGFYIRRKGYKQDGSNLESRLDIGGSLVALFGVREGNEIGSQHPPGLNSQSSISEIQRIKQHHSTGEYLKMGTQLTLGSLQPSRTFDEGKQMPLIAQIHKIKTALHFKNGEAKDTQNDQTALQEPVLICGRSPDTSKVHNVITKVPAHSIQIYKTRRRSNFEVQRAAYGTFPSTTTAIESTNSQAAATNEATTSRTTITLNFDPPLRRTVSHSEALVQPLNSNLPDINERKELGRAQPVQRLAVSVPLRSSSTRSPSLRPRVSSASRVPIGLGERRQMNKETPIYQSFPSPDTFGMANPTPEDSRSHNETHSTLHNKPQDIPELQTEGLQPGGYTSGPQMNQESKSTPKPRNSTWAKLLSFSLECFCLERRKRGQQQKIRNEVPVPIEYDSTVEPSRHHIGNSASLLPPAAVIEDSPSRTWNTHPAFELDTSSTSGYLTEDDGTNVWSGWLRIPQQHTREPGGRPGSNEQTQSPSPSKLTRFFRSIKTPRKQQGATPDSSPLLTVSTVQMKADPSAEQGHMGIVTLTTTTSTVQQRPVNSASDGRSSSSPSPLFLFEQDGCKSEEALCPEPPALPNGQAKQPSSQKSSPLPQPPTSPKKRKRDLTPIPGTSASLVESLGICSGSVRARISGWESLKNTFHGAFHSGQFIAEGRGAPKAAYSFSTRAPVPLNELGGIPAGEISSGRRTYGDLLVSNPPSAGAETPLILTNIIGFGKARNKKDKKRGEAGLTFHAFVLLQLWIVQYVQKY
ncbi:hypothetical protein BDZ91DRAFT_786896 [Kalaharituber pfeilii]|nr:hypothetical protein BDZ91DRAFT_786896 [Kalaharituber pfeilii]